MESNYLIKHGGGKGGDLLIAVNSKQPCTL